MITNFNVSQAWKEISVESTKYAIPEAYKEKKDIRDDEPLSLFLPEPVAREGICCLHLLDVSCFPSSFTVPTSYQL